MNINQNALNWAYSGILAFATWKGLPQGHKWWSEAGQALKALGAKELLVEDWWSRPPSTEKVQFIEETARALSAAFCWAKSPQGHDFWADRHKALRKYATEMKKELEAPARRAEPSAPPEPPATKDTPTLNRDMHERDLCPELMPQRSASQALPGHAWRDIRFVEEDPRRDRRKG